MHLAVADVDCRDMRGAALQQDFGKAAGRGADVETGPAGRVELEMVEPRGKLQGGARDVILCRIGDRDGDIGQERLAGLGDDLAADPDRAAKNGVARPRPACEQAEREQQLIEALRRGERHGVSMGRF